MSCRSIFYFSDHFIEVAFPFKEGYFISKECGSKRVASGAPQVTPQVKELMLAVGEEQSRNEIQDILGLADRKYFRENHLYPAIDLGLLEMTQPDLSNSPTQKYRLTEKGKELKQYLKSK